MIVDKAAQWRAAIFVLFTG